LVDFESDGTGVDERVLSTLLNELDGIQARGAIFVVGSSNRPDKIDEAMLRPGEDTLIVGLQALC